MAVGALLSREKLNEALHQADGNFLIYLYVVARLLLHTALITAGTDASTDTTAAPMVVVVAVVLMLPRSGVRSAAAATWALSAAMA